jgi:hypothetical protein
MKVADWLTEYLQTTVVEYVLPLPLASAGKTEQIYSTTSFVTTILRPPLTCVYYDGFISSYSGVLVHKTTALQMVSW